MRVELAPDLPEDTAEALDAEGRPLAQLRHPDPAPAGTEAIRVSPTAFNRILAALSALEQK